MGYSKKLTSFKNARDRMVPSRSVYTKDVKIAIIALRRVMDKVDFMAYRLLCIVKDGHYLYAVRSAFIETFLHLKIAKLLWDPRETPKMRP